jgi:hypothetical protein
VDEGCGGLVGGRYLVWVWVLDSGFVFVFVFVFDFWLDRVFYCLYHSQVYLILSCGIVSYDSYGSKVSYIWIFFRVISYIWDASHHTYIQTCVLCFSIV